MGTNGMHAWSAAVVVAVMSLAGWPAAGDAATRYWSLQNVATVAGAKVVGSFGYDDATGQVTAWNLRIESGNGFLPFTYTPGNTTTWAGGIGVPETFGVRFNAPPGSAPDVRFLLLRVPKKLDGSSTSVQLLTLDPVSMGYFSAECGGEFGCRGIGGGSLVLVPFPPPVGLVDVIEFYHDGFDHYFISADPAEIQKLDTGVFKGWKRTGQQFKAYAIGSSGGAANNPVCRYYGLPAAGLDSHFYSASAVECFQVYVKFAGKWQFEGDNVFQIDLPDPTTGACPTGTIAVYRVFNNRVDANHRYLVSLSLRAAMEAAGWIREGYGATATIMCAVAN